MKKLNHNNHQPGFVCLAIVLAASLLANYVSMATPYASQVVSNNNSVTFILNQEAQGLVVLRDGGSPVYPGTNAGQHSFDMTGFTSFQIIVTGNTPKAWTKFVPDGTDRSFYLPRGIAINKNPKSPNFGKVYVSESRGGTTASTTYGRTTSDGIYVLRADGVAAGGPHTGGIDWTLDLTAASSPLRSAIGPDDHLYVVGITNTAYEFNDDMSVATPLLDDSNKTAGQGFHSIWVEGTKTGGNRKIYVVNGVYTDARRGLIAYDLAGNDAAALGDIGTQIISPEAFNYYPYDVVRDSGGYWYMNQYRATAGQALALQKFDGSIVPNNTPVWSVPNTYVYTESLDINEAAGVIAVGRYDNGMVYFFDLATGELRESFDCGNRAREQAFDAAGNLVTVDNGAEWARFWSPGGYTVASTSSDGTFHLFTPDNLSVASAADPVAAEEGADTATFTISRFGGANIDQQIYFALSGTAASNVDYTISPSSPFTFKAGETSTNITITPINDGEREPTETVVLTLVPSPDYYITSQNSATATLVDNDLVVRYWDANGSEYGSGLTANGTWGTDNFWSTSVDGTAATGAWQDWALAVFSAGADWSTFTVTVNGTQAVDGPSIEDSLVTFSGGTLLLTNYSGIAVASSAQVTMNSILAGVSGMTKDGPGTLVLGAANTYTGPTTINDGIAQLAGAERIPDSSGVYIGATATLDLFGNNETVGSLAGAAGAIANAAGVTLTFGGDNTDTLWNGNANSGGSLVKVGTGATRMTAGEMADPLTVLGGAISINAAARLGSVNPVTLDNGAALESVSEGVGSDFITPGRTITIAAGGGTLEVANASAILMVHDASVISGPGILTKEGPGELRTYSVEHSFGKLIVNAGLYTAGHSTSLGYNTSFGAIPTTLTPDAITIQNGAAIRKAGGQNVTLDPKQGITLGPGGGTIRAFSGGTDTGTFEIPGPISGSGPLGLNATADAAYSPIMVLSGANTYSGGTTINAGVADVRGDGGLGSGNVTVASGATLKLSLGTANTYINPAATLTLNGAAPRVDLAFTGSPNVINALYIGGAQMAAGTWGAIGSGAAHESALLTGTGTLRVAGGVAPQPVTSMTIGTAAGGGFNISYSGGTGGQFVLLRSIDVAARVETWTRVDTNTTASGSFTIPVGTDPQAFYRIQSE